VTLIEMRDVTQIVDQLIARFNDPHPRVRWAAINAMGQLETDLGPELQENFHAKVLFAAHVHHMYLSVWHRSS
jgi:hypothetical protein